MSKSILYAANVASQTVPVGSKISFGSPVRKYGGNITLRNGDIVIEGAGYYDIDVNITYTGIGNATFTVYQDGVAISGATTTNTLITNATGSVSIPVIARTYCCKPSVITVEVSGIEVTISNASVVVEKE